jgi:hypothetical protein
MQTRTSSRNLDVAGVLKWCAETAVPVGVPVSVAIASHRIAFADFLARDDATVKDISMCALRAVILARTPDVQDYRDELEYLSGLPLSAWEGGCDYPAETVKQETLAGIEHNIRCIRGT